MMWPWSRRDRFSLDELRYLTEQLQRTTTIIESNKDSIVETLRSIAELMIWGDQHDPSFFDFFMEKQVMGLFIQTLKISSQITGVAVQLLQSLSIMIQNIRSEHAIYYLFSNEYINQLITYPFNFHHEELLQYYISFLRTISTKLDQTTVSFFVKTKNDEVISFPLYSEALKFFHHEETMVRIAVRALTLNVYHVNDDSIQKFILSPQVAGYFSDLVTFLRQQSLTLDGLVADATKALDSSQTIGRLEGGIAETEELLDYCEDITSAGIPELSRVMTEHMLWLLVIPVLLHSLHPSWSSGSRHVGSPQVQVSTLTAVYLLSRLSLLVRHKPLANGIGMALLLRSMPCKTKLSDLSGDALMRSSSRHGIIPGPESANSSNSANVEHSRSPGQGRSNTGETDFNQLTESLASANGGKPISSPREILLSHMLGNNEKLILASLCLFIALLQNDAALDDTILDALGLLPQRKQHKRRLLLELMGSKSDEELLFSSSPRTIKDDIDNEYGDLNVCNFNHFTVYVERVRSKGEANHIDNNNKRNEVLEALMQLVCRRPSPCAEALWLIGWLLWQLLPNREDKPSTYENVSLDIAYSEAKNDILKELTDCWCDAIPTIIVSEWKICKKAMENPSLQKESSFVLMPSNQSSLAKDNLSSSAAGERVRAVVKVFVALYQVRNLLIEGSFKESLPMGQPKNALVAPRIGRAGFQLDSITVGAEVDLTPGDAMPCRVSFERGKEKAVYLLVATWDTSGSLILAESTSSNLSRGIIRLIAPLAGSLPRIDEEHGRWLHLRIRSPNYPSSEAQKIGGSLGGARTRRLVDGRWTLAFPDEESCKKAKLAVVEKMSIQQNNVEEVLHPLLSA
ncbi:hypothetical protein O6H91_18G033200 [Diphasiastrum complanatum]|uniref:Uncharacterized protein n=1 Tax=Diphasiastrum complanatum TaxID=34168 RepID=A0ACC2AZM6_DIPCM|nr:hypothetical protein O6H91_18G033200 [Diphasiastrum complanatum]